MVLALHPVMRGLGYLILSTLLWVGAPLIVPEQPLSPKRRSRYIDGSSQGLSEVALIRKGSLDRRLGVRENCIGYPLLLSFRWGLACDEPNFMRSERHTRRNNHSSAWCS